ncbi:hypothetical protein SAMN05421790_10316 [Kroppenstedtia eburnea]|uniref:Uncharacterized protein n=1 Tax=Kroppenstedtia eburnea TaxID=714067 RepID=A0A1N7KE16_9BACL|nr:hypothetical protein SAMN05421790_10316 [Kroppenstedtia eburnea]
MGIHMTFSLFFRAKVIPCETQPSVHSETRNEVTLARLVPYGYDGFFTTLL